MRRCRSSVDIARGDCPRVAAARRVSWMICSSGRAKAPVLPLPVSAAWRRGPGAHELRTRGRIAAAIALKHAAAERGRWKRTTITSPPPRTTGMASPWTSVARLRRGRAGRSRRPPLGLSSAHGPPTLLCSGVYELGHHAKLLEGHLEGRPQEMGGRAAVPPHCTTDPTSHRWNAHVRVCTGARRLWCRGHGGGFTSVALAAGRIASRSALEALRATQPKRPRIPRPGR